MSTPNWDRLWRTAGIQFVAFFVICCVIYGHLPGVSASADASAAFGALFLLLIAIGAGLAYSIAGSGNHALASGLNGLGWALLVLSSFPRAMLTMSGAFRLWRAGLVWH